MIIPYSTDAPLYHLPIVTGVMICVNIVVFCMTTLQVALGNVEPESIQWLMIQFNQINPLQWLTGHFMHADVIHLLGNMFFLFAFGLVVEGKAGNIRFLMMYLAMATAIGAIAQVPMYLLGGEGAALGASAIIFALMVIAVVWAPENELEGFYWIFIFYGTFEARIMSFGLLFIGWELFLLILTGFTMSGAMGHVIGVLVGIPVAFYMLRHEIVDCEGWDLVSRNDWLKKYPFLYGDKQRAREEADYHEVENPVATALALTGGDSSAGRTLGVAVEAPATKPAKKKPKRPAAKKKPRKLMEPSVSEQLQKKIQSSQSHPEFNRLAFVLRQNVQSANLPAATQAFQKLDSLTISCGLNETSLMNYAMALANQKQWVDAIRPLSLIVEKGETLSDDACLRIAQIHLRVLKRPDQAISILERIAVPDGVVIDAAKKAKLKKRDEMLRQAKQTLNAQI